MGWKDEELLPLISQAHNLIDSSVWRDDAPPHLFVISASLFRNFLGILRMGDDYEDACHAWQSRLEGMHQKKGAQ